MIIKRENKPTFSSIRRQAWLKANDQLKLFRCRREERTIKVRYVFVRCDVWCSCWVKGGFKFAIAICYFYFVYSPFTLSTVFLINLHFICPLQKVFLLFIYTVRGKNFAVTSNALYSNLLVQIKLMVLLKPDKGVHLRCPGNLEILGLLY